MRVTRHLAETALDVMEGARDVGDEIVANACRRVRTAYLLGKPVDGETAALVQGFAE
jgi:hypothetical protein